MSNSTEGSRPLSAEEEATIRERVGKHWTTPHINFTLASIRGLLATLDRERESCVEQAQRDADQFAELAMELQDCGAENERLCAGHGLHLSKIAELRARNERLEARVKESNTLTDTLREQVRLLVESSSIAEYERLVTQVESMRAVVEAADRYESVEVGALVAPIYEELEAAVKAYRARQGRSRAESEAGMGEGESDG